MKLLLISINFLHKGPICTKPALGQIIAQCQKGNKPLSEPLMTNTHHLASMCWVYCDSVVKPNETMMGQCNTQIAKCMAPTWGPPGSCWPQMGPMLAPWTFLSGYTLMISLLCDAQHIVKPANIWAAFYISQIHVTWDMPLILILTRVTKIPVWLIYVGSLGCTSCIFPGEGFREITITCKFACIMMSGQAVINIVTINENMLIFQKRCN